MKPTQRQRVKSWLLEHGSITNVEAIQNRILRLSERVRELQEQGMEIQSAREEHGVWRYTLAGGPKPKLVAVRGPNGVRLVPEDIAREQGLAVLD